MKPAPTIAEAGATTYHENIFFENGGIISHPCGSEAVECTGTTHHNLHFVSNNNGGHFSHHDNDQGVTCVGQDTGRTYRSTYATNDTYNFGPNECVEEACNATFAGHWDLQAPGPGNDMRIHVVEHFAFNGNGVLTSDFSRVNITCTD